MWLKKLAVILTIPFVKKKPCPNKEQIKPGRIVFYNNIPLEIKENVISAYNRLVYTYDDIIGKGGIKTLDAPWNIFLRRSEADLLLWLLKSGKCKSLSEEETAELTTLIETAIKTTPLVAGVLES